MTEPIHPYSQKIKIEQISNGIATLVFHHGQKIEWPVDLLPENKKAGDELKMIIHDSKTEQEEREKLAKTVLNEIFSSTES